MRFLVDAQLPRRLALAICDWGDEAVHTLDLPEGNRTTDDAILAKAKSQRYVVVTKDADFVDSFLLKREPEKLLLIATGNISNAALLELLETHWSQILDMLVQGDFVEVGTSSLTLHG